MNKIFTLLMLAAMATAASAQTAPAVQPYGKVDQADLKMTACDFEKDANAEVLFNKGTVYFGADLISVIMEVHKRIKIFNDNGKKEADIRIKYISADHLEYITGIQAETINLVDGKTEITKLDKKQIYTKSIDKARSEITFSLPNVKPGSIIEFKYNWNSKIFYDFPEWDFQDKIPVKYSELSTATPDVFYFRAMSHIYSEFVKHTHTTEGRSLPGEGTESFPYNLEIETRGIANIPSLPDEPFMSSFRDNVQSIHFQLISIRPIGGFSHSYSDTWNKVGGELADDDDFGGQLKRKLSNEDAIITKAKALKTDEAKVAYIFNEVKNIMKWDGHDDWETNDGTSHAWDTKTGNSAEVNLILYHLLKQAGVEAYPMVVSTRDNGKIDRYYTSLAQFNRAVVYVPLDSTKNYILDVTNKYNSYNEIPEELLNSSGLYIDKAKKVFAFVNLKKEEPARQVVLINAEIKAGGKLEGTADISSNSYNRINAINRYKTDGEKKYIDFLRNDDNNLKIASIKFENMDVDTLPLVQRVNFNLDMAGSDENYIYLNPNLFTPLKTNPFLSENRKTDIDFGYLRSYSINGIYKVPAGYKVDALPKSVTLVMPDKSVTFKRMVAEQDGSIAVRYNISYNKVAYAKNDYPDFHEFFKKMHEMLNEQVVLKKL
ncbi:MAG: DUF3857 domain-containing protein [Mucilaginibacter sp.]